MDFALAGGGLFALFILGFIGTIFAIIAYVIFRAIKEWSDNNKRPIETVRARVVAKRNKVSGSSTESGGSTSTWYYATFETTDGERREFGVGGPQFGLLVEGDLGALTFQGTRFKGFERTRV